jgi:hypothetical protein
MNCSNWSVTRRRRAGQRRLDCPATSAQRLEQAGAVAHALDAHARLPDEI